MNFAISQVHSAVTSFSIECQPGTSDIAGHLQCLVHPHTVAIYILNRSSRSKVKIQHFGQQQLGSRGDLELQTLAAQSSLRSPHRVQCKLNLVHLALLLCGYMLRETTGVVLCQSSRTADHIGATSDWPVHAAVRLSTVFLAHRVHACRWQVFKNKPSDLNCCAPQRHVRTLILALCH